MPRHPPIALTSRLRIHTTIDRPVLLAGCDYRWFGLFGTIMVEDTIEPTQLDNHCCNQHRSSLRHRAEARCRQSSHNANHGIDF
jgi:hypothetical protein